jgi:hypothetical protein
VGSAVDGNSAGEMWVTASAAWVYVSESVTGSTSPRTSLACLNPTNTSPPITATPATIILNDFIPIDCLIPLLYQSRKKTPAILSTPASVAAPRSRRTHPSVVRPHAHPPHESSPLPHRSSPSPAPTPRLRFRHFARHVPLPIAGTPCSQSSAPGCTRLQRLIPS